MPLARYGVCIGTLDHFGPNEQGTWYHGTIYVNTPGGQYQCSVDVATQSTVRVQYQVLHKLPTDVFAPILTLSDGYHDLQRTPTSGALDYIRSQFLTNRGCLTVFWAIWQAIFQQGPWTDSNGTNAINEMDALVSGSSRLFVFGEPYTTGLGMHNVHMNQGDPPLSPDGRDHQGDDGIWQDGGTVVQKPDGTLHAFISKFSSQSLNTNDAGLPI